MPDGIGGLPDLSGKRVLVVDDNDDHAELVFALIRAVRGEAFMARNADTALSYLAMSRFDVLISDLRMPGKDGLALIRAVRAASAPYKTIPAIAMTSFHEDYPRPKVFDAGFNAFLPKPLLFEVETFAPVLREVLGAPGP